jgi:class 3 adenylate cyclase
VRDRADIEKLKQAIASLKAQRQTLGDQIIESALAPIRKKLKYVQATDQMKSRKLGTVLFADLADSTGLFARLDPDDVHELLSAYYCLKKLHRGTRRSGGEIHRRCRDGRFWSLRYAGR